jgi:endoglucanase Acf2
VIIFSSSANRTKALTGPYKDHYIYNTVIRAIIESALIVWMGLLTYAIATTCWFALVAANPNTTYNTPLTAIYGVSPLLDDGAINEWEANFSDRPRTHRQ